MSQNKEIAKIACDRRVDKSHVLKGPPFRGLFLKEAHGKIKKIKTGKKKAHCDLVDHHRCVIDTEVRMKGPKHDLR